MRVESDEVDSWSVRLEEVTYDEYDGWELLHSQISESEKWNLYAQ